MDLNFHQLRLFYRAVQIGSFSKTAEDLAISQPAVSTQIRELETFLDLKLFERSGKTLKLTQAGEVVFRYAQEIFALTREMEKSLQNLKGLMSGYLRLISSTTVGECILPTALGHFNRAFPGIELEVQITNTSHVLEQVLSRQFDLGFIGEDPNVPELIISPFYADNIVLFVSANHRLAGRNELDIEAISDLAFITREQGSATRRTAEKALLELGLQPKVAMELGSNEAVKRAVSAGLGIGMLSQASLLPEIKAGMLKILKIEGLKCSRQFSVIYRKDHELALIEKHFLEVVINSLPNIA
jgi:DNA-binding transcriptional LysR family regulator